MRKRDFLYLSSIFFLFLSIFSCKKVEPTNHKEIRIVSLTPSITRILFHLDAGSSIVGVTDYCDVNDELFHTLIKDGKIERLSSFSSPNIEKLIYVNPTIIFGMDSFSYETKTKLDKLFGDKLHWFRHPKNYSEITNQIIEIATIFGEQERGINLVNDMNSRLEETTKKVSKVEEKKRVLVEIYPTPFTTCGKNTFIASIITNAGGVLAFNSADNWPTPTTESIIAADFDIILKTHVASGDHPVYYKDKPIFVPSDISFYLQPGVESIYAIEELYSFLYENNSNNL